MHWIRYNLFHIFNVWLEQIILNSMIKQFVLINILSLQYSNTCSRLAYWAGCNGTPTTRTHTRVAYQNIGYPGISYSRPKTNINTSAFYQITFASTNTSKKPLRKWPKSGVCYIPFLGEKVLFRQNQNYISIKCISE